MYIKENNIKQCIIVRKILSVYYTMPVRYIKMFVYQTMLV